MSDQNETTAVELPEALGGTSPTSAVLEQILDIEAALSSARRAERTAKICLRADLEAELYDVLSELSTLVDPEGNVLDAGESSLGDASPAVRAQTLSERAQALQADMAGATKVVRFRAMDSDAWDAFEKEHRTADGKAKDMRDYSTKLVAATAIAPLMTEAQVDALRKKLGSRQINELSNAAYAACTQGGVDVPKLPSFSLVQKPEDS